LDDNGNVFSIGKQNRIFRNAPTLRYTGSIHEALVHVPEQLHITDSISILHTGYTKSAMALTQKDMRNIKMLSAEVERYPDDANRKGYLAASLIMSAASDPSNTERAVEIYREVVSSGQELNDVVANSSHNYLIKLALHINDYEEVIRLCASAQKMIADSPDYHYWHGLALYQLERYDEAWEQFMGCYNLILNATLINTNIGGSSFLFELFNAMAKTAMQRGDSKNAAKYLIFALKQKKHEEGVCSKLMSVLRAACKENDREIINYLSNFYDFEDPRDKLFLAKCAKTAKDEVLMIFFFRQLTAADKAELTAQQGESA
jgi:Flp pilus assembly protein TadD